jgi:hypothetical protein
MRSMRNHEVTFVGELLCPPHPFAEYCRVDIRFRGRWFRVLETPNLCAVGRYLLVANENWSRRGWGMEGKERMRRGYQVGQQR